MERQPTPNKDRSNDADRAGAERRGRTRRSGEGADSALANLRQFERDRQRSRPADDDENRDPA